MQEPSQQEPKPRSPVGYRPLVPADLAMSLRNAHYGYVAAAAVLGVVMGVAIGLTAGHAKVAAAPGVSIALSTHTSGLRMLPAAYAGPAPSLLSRADNRKNAGAGSAALATVSDKPASEPAKARKRHGLHKLLDWKRASRDRAGLKRMPYVSQNPPAAPDEPTALQLATAAEAAGPFFLDIQGDLTVASFDAASGTIETYEGETYTLASAASGGSSIPWQDYPFNVHYRCDEAGNCTLFHGGASATAKLTR